MVRAILGGTKAQTRRVVKQSLERLGDGDWYAFDHGGINYRVNARHTTVAAWAHLLQFCPYGQPGDRLWVRETWRTEQGYDHIRPRDIPIARNGKTLAVPFWYDVDIPNFDGEGITGLTPGKRRPGMFMPRAASRILLEITAVSVERLQDITVSDAIREGYDGSSTDPVDPSIKWFSALWESINGAGSWTRNDWVWVVEFKRVQA